MSIETNNKDKTKKKKRKKKMPAFVKGILIFLLAIIAIAGGYVGYVFGTYERIDDYEEVVVNNPEHMVPINENAEFTFITCNAGFGAYSDDYSFFMDGGKYSRAFSKEAVITNIAGTKSIVANYDPDFVFYQEIDIDSDRSYHVNERESICTTMNDYAYDFAINYDSAYLFYPVTEPHGASKSGLLTFSRYRMKEAVRRSLPISTGFSKIFDLDRCYVKTIIKLSEADLDEDGNEIKQLVIYNVHLSAYTDDITIVDNQIEMLAQDMKAEYDAGNYVVCGGDFNQDLLGNSPEIFGTEDTDANWARPFPKDKLPEGFALYYEKAPYYLMQDIIPSCRNADKPYVEGECFVTMVDGFIVSDNVEVRDFEIIDTGFRYSDHNPVMMKIKLIKE